MKISIVIPTWNEEGVIGNTIAAIRERSSNTHEIVVADGGSSDGTCSEAASAGATLLKAGVRGRAAQMNRGAEHAAHEVLFFLHADTIPPVQFDRHIERTLATHAEGGCFRLSFSHHHPLLAFYGWCTRFSLNAFRYGDQGLFLKKELFHRLEGFREDHLVMEDNEFVTRFRRRHRFSVVPEQVTTSARRYLDVGVVRLQAAFAGIWFLYHIGVSQRVLAKRYGGWIAGKHRSSK